MFQHIKKIVRVRTPLYDDNPDRRLNTSTRMGDLMVKAIDDLNLVSMLLQGITLKEAAIRREKQSGEEQLKGPQSHEAK